MKMSDQQIRASVASMNMSERHKAMILKRALAGEQEARLVVFAKARKVSA